MRTNLRRASARIDYCQVDPVVLAFAGAARIARPGSAHQLLWGPAGLRARTPHAIAAFLSEAPHRFAHWFAPIRAALLQVPTPEHTREFEIAVMKQDATDDLARIQYQQEPTGENAKKLVATLDRSIEQMLAYRQSLVAKHRLEGQ